MNKNIYFPGLNAIRAFAAFSVVIYHINNISMWFNLGPDDIFLKHLVLNSYDAVILFFVLSGFLITYLLLEEIRKTQTVSVKKFYIRRILRIWPLYYLIVFVGFVVLPLIEILIGSPGYSSVRSTPIQTNAVKLLGYLVLLPHIGAYFGSFTTGIGQLWSIGVEENFYLIWPWLAKKFSKQILKVLLIIIVVKIALYVLPMLLQSIVGFPPLVITVINVIASIQIEFMAIGGLGAYILFYRYESLLKIIFNPVIEKLVLLLMVGNIFLFNGATWASAILVALIYILFILNVCSNPKSTLKLENRIFNGLGRISYGIYVIHVPVMYVVAMVLSQTFKVSNIGFVPAIILYVGVIALTIGVAQLSYTYFEQPFLKLKRTFVVVESGEQGHKVDTETQAGTGLIDVVHPEVTGKT